MALPNTFANATTATGAQLDANFSTLDTNINAISLSSGSSLVGFVQAGTGAVAETVQDILRRHVDVIGQGADLTGVTSSSTAFTNAAAIGSTLFIPKGTYKISTNVDLSSVRVVFDTGAKLSIDTGIVVTIGDIDSKLQQIFSGVGTVTVTSACKIAYPEWWGAIGNNTADDGAAINASIIATATNSVHLHFKNSYKTGQTISFLSTGVYSSDANSNIGSFSAYANGPVISSGSWKGMHTIPSISGFSANGLTLAGCNTANITCPLIAGCGTAIVFQTRNASYANCLDNNVNVNQIGNLTNGIVFDSDNSANVIQGNVVVGNFMNNISAYGVTCITDNTNTTGNKVVFQAFDMVTTNASAIMVYNGLAGTWNALTVRVEGWCGGLNATAKFISGKFSNLNLFMNKNSPNTDMVAGQVLVTSGPNNKIDFNHYGTTTEIAASLTAANLAGFNGGVPLWKRKNSISYTLGADLGANVTRNFYVYHQCTDGTSFMFDVVTYNSVGGGGGVIIERVYDNSATNANELLVTIRNVSGAIITNGTVLHFTLGLRA